MMLDILANVFGATFSKGFAHDLSSVLVGFDSYSLTNPIYMVFLGCNAMQIRAYSAACSTISYRHSRRIPRAIVPRDFDCRRVQWRCGSFCSLLRILMEYLMVYYALSSCEVRFDSSLRRDRIARALPNRGLICKGWRHPAE